MHASGFSRFRLTLKVCVLALLWGQAGFAPYLSGTDRVCIQAFQGITI